MSPRRRGAPGAYAAGSFQHVHPWGRGTEEWHALTLNRLLPGRVRREWRRVRRRDECRVRAHARSSTGVNVRVSRPHRVTGRPTHATHGRVRPARLVTTA